MGNIFEHKKNEASVIGTQTIIISAGDKNDLNIEAFISAYLNTNIKLINAITKKLATVAIGAP